MHSFSTGLPDPGFRHRNGRQPTGLGKVDPVVNTPVKNAIVSDKASGPLDSATGTADNPPGSEKLSL